jgi:transmembrane sensor
MALDQLYWKKISRYLGGEMTGDERLSFEEWINESAENKNVFEEALHIWESSTIKYRVKDETEALWLRLQKRIEQQNFRHRMLVFFDKNKSWIGIAACVFFLAGVGALIFWPAVKSPDTISAVGENTTDEITIESGNEVATIYLPDSTRVWLNIHSKLTYAKDYGNGSRATKLQGEGYFLVKRNEKIPFTIDVKNAFVKVLGTTFNVKEDSNEVVLTVAQGSVQFGNSPSNREIVKAKERAVLTKDERITKTKNTDTGFAVWRLKNNPFFENEKNMPLAFLNNAYAWRKNHINQSVIEGTIKNVATLASYKDMVLEITYTKRNGNVATVEIAIDEVVEAGKSIRYKHRLLDILSHTRDVQVKLQSAQVANL